MLATEFSVSVGTIQQAIDNLIASGEVRTEHGRGTYVNSASTPDPVPATHSKPRGAGPLRITVVAGMHPSHTNHRDPSIQTTLNSIERACGQMGGSISYCKRQLDGSDWEPIAKTIARIDTSKTDGVIVVGITKSVETPVDFVAAANTIAMPLVCLAAGELPAAIPHVFYDNRFGGYSAAQHLLEKGHTQIAYLSPYRASWSKDRFTGITQAIEQRGLATVGLEVFPQPETVPSVDEIGFLSFDMAREMAYSYSKVRLAAGDPPRAVIAVNDPAAFGFMDAASELGLEAGRDYAIVGFDNTDDARECDLTSLQRPWEAMAEEAVRLVFSIANGKYAATQVRMQPHLVPRSSTALYVWEMNDDRVGQGLKDIDRLNLEQVTA
jgi:DNA-binding LacI/PurR family transcriptional regulator